MIHQNLSTLRKLMLLKGVTGGSKAIEATATGNPLTFGTDVSKPLKSLLIPFTPKQTGSGDPSPDNIRPIVPWNGLTVNHGGKNLLKNKTAVRGSTSIYIGQDTSNEYPVYLVKGAKYTLTFECDGSNTPQVYIQQSGGSAISFGTGKSVTYTVTETGYYRMYVYVAGGVTEVTDFMLEAGETATAYEPYVPITEIDIVFPALGKNLLDANQQNIMYQNVSPSHGSYEIVNGNALTVTRTDTTACAMLLKVFKITSEMVGKTFSFSGKLNGGNLGGSDVFVLCDETGDNRKTKTNPYTITAGDVGSFLTARLWNNVTGTLAYINLQVEQGETPTAFEPYVPVYGGTLDVVSGVLTVEYVCETTNGRTWQLVGQGAYQSGHSKGKPVDSTDIAKQNVCTHWKNTDMETMNNVMINQNSFLWLGANAINAFGLQFGQITSQDIEDYFEQQAQNGTPLYVCAPLYEPQEIQLTPTQLTALVGDNTIWSDANGQMTAVYLKKG